MKNRKKYILILIIFVITFLILNFYKSQKSIFEDIMIFGLWDNKKVKNEYIISSQNTVKVDVFTSINNKKYKKIAPGSRGSFIIKFKRTMNSAYKIRINEKTSKPQNLVFWIQDKKYLSLKEMEDLINKQFINAEKITINWEWKYYINDNNDRQDTEDGKNANNYFFEIEAVVEEQERTEI